MEKYDILIMVTEKDLNVLKMMLPYCKKNIDSKRICIVANKKIKQKVCEIEDITFIDEDTVYDGMTLDSVADIIENICNERKRAGWYLQQFLKLAWAYKCQDKRYIVLDSDTFPLNKIEFIDDNGICLFTKKVEYHKPYFDTLKKLFDGTVSRERDFSFVAEHMIFECEYVKELIKKIEGNKNLIGNTFYEKILRAINKDDLLKSGFSEFETYGNYMLVYHPESVHIRSLRTQREAMVLIGSHPTLAQLEWASKDYDLISIEGDYCNNSLMIKLSSSAIIRKIFKLKTFARIRSRIRTVYRKLTKKQDFKLEDN